MGGAAGIAGHDAAGSPDVVRGHRDVTIVEGIEAGPDVEAELIAFCSDNLAKYKVPRSIDFRQDFPRTETGKLLKRQLRDPFWADKDSQLV